jgi:acyl-lipid omega-6 desaturase (Delta-12 desaturase)
MVAQPVERVTPATPITQEPKTQISRSSWYRSLANYEKPDRMKAIFQLLNTVVPYIGLWALMAWIIRTGASYWLLVPCVVVASGLLIRIFIFFHDCCHGSFFSSRSANRFWGYVTGLMIFTPFEDWRHHHAGHHATSADLDRRGIGDIWTMTVEEYVAAPLRTRIAYRLFRNPLVLFGLGPPIIFIISHRFTHKGMGPRERTSVMLTNLLLVTVIGAVIWAIGLKSYLLIQVPTMSLASAVGIWLFYVQHQFEDDYWARHDEWDPMRAALEGSSYYKLPKVLQWVTGNIGLHHIHHLRPRIPNYNLQRCFDDIPELQAVEPLTISSSIHCLWMNLWDETERKMISFRALKRRRQHAAS